MGYNTAVLVLNDAAHVIGEDPEFGKNLYRAICEVQRGKEVDISSKGFCNAATVVETHHADGTSIVAFGQNCATKIAELYGVKHYSEWGKLDIIRELADQAGYRLVKKSARKRK